jgi:hypothetical protein
MDLVLFYCKGLEETDLLKGTLLLPIRVNHSIRIAQDYMDNQELVWSKLPKGI